MKELIRLYSIIPVILAIFILPKFHWHFHTIFFPGPFPLLLYFSAIILLVQSFDKEALWPHIARGVHSDFTTRTIEISI